MLQCKTKWKKKKLGNLGYTYSGLSNKTIDDFGSGEDFIPYMNIYKNSIIKTDKFEQVKVGLNERQNQVQCGDVFFTTSSETPDEVGLTSVLIDEIDKPLYLNSFCFGFRLNDNNEFDNKFLAYLLRGESIRSQISKMAQGSTRYNLSKTQLLDKLKLYYPEDKKEQSRMADILLNCDKVIEKTEETIEKCKQIKAGMMQDLFTRGLDENGKLRPAYSQSPDLYKYSEELRRFIPKEWDVKTFCELYQIPSKNGLTKPSKVRGSGYKMINMGELFANKKIGNIQMELVPLSEMEKRNFEINIYDLLFARQSLIAEGAGKCSIVTNIGSYTTFESHIIRIRLDKTLYHPMYYLYLFDSNLSPTKKLIQVGAQAGIRGSELAMVNVTCPKYEEQEKIKDCLEKIDNKIDLEYKLLQKYKQIKQGLMKQLLTPPADAEIVEE